MDYFIFAGLGLIAVIGCSFWFLYAKNQKPKPFKRNKRHTFLMWGLAVFVGLSGFLFGKYEAVSAITMGWFLVCFFIVTGVFHYRFLKKRDEINYKEALPYLFFIATTSSLLFFVFFWMLEAPFFKITTGLADNFALLSIFSLIPYSLKLAHEFWNDIPIIKQELVPWEFPPSVPALLENGSCSLNFQVKINTNARKRAVIPIRVLSKYTIGEVFHRAIYEYNVIRNAVRPIEIAEGNQKDKLYSWHFFLLNGRDENSRKNYIDPDATMNELGLKRGGTIYTERAKK